MPLEVSFSTDGKEFTPPSFLLPGAHVGLAGQDEMLVIKARLGNDGADIFSVPRDLAAEHPDDANPLMQEEHQVDVVPENGEVVRDFVTDDGYAAFLRIRHVAKLAISPYRIIGPS